MSRASFGKIRSPSNHLLICPQPSEKTVQRVAWSVKGVVPTQNRCVFESDEFRFPLHDDSCWKIHFECNSTTLEVQLMSIPKGKPVHNIAGIITFSGKPDEKFVFGPGFINSGESLDFRRDGCNLTQPDLELSIDLWVPEELGWNPFNFSSSGSLPEDMMSLLFSEDFSDVAVEVEGESIPAHKNILSARSNVFMAMFKSGMLENQKSCVTITDTRSEVVKEMLRYVYTGQVIKLENFAAELMIAADKYNMADLKNKCRNWLISNINKELAAKHLVVADYLNDEGLKKAVTDYIVLNLAEVVDSAEWKSMIKSHPLLMADVLKTVCRYTLTPK